ncbi:ASKHA domain-containing protein [Labrys sp. ZIDIC5]|uniref:ASKHA domain-containing protein n=1 Tax=Labrys sedimenti TaxID=3106036 RepID=UPI002ACA0D9D|nr:ASKHA domain-containing protein [Labrys sp. ZIDIC5]MDZ5453238.1 ASKHA domain-containing protein [Labrys sp. ZIDIC5]
MTNPLVFFAPSGKRGRFPEGTSVLEAARKLGVDLDSVCGGRGICGRCQVEVGDGKFPKLGITSASDHVTEWNAVEERYVSKRGPLAEGRRLGCQAKLCSDVVIDVPPDSQVHRQVVRKSAAIRDIAIEPVVALHYVEVREPDMHEPSSDFRRLQEALEQQWGLKDITAPLESLRLLQWSLRQGQWSVTVAIRHKREIVGIWPGLHEQGVGLAVDIGSTTIAAHLCDLASGEVLASSGVMNPQIRFGEDVMSRVSYVMMNPGGDVELTTAVREAIAELAVSVTKEVGLNSNDILEMTVVANPIMHHLFLGLDPTELGGAPFALTIDGAYQTRAAHLNLPLSSGAYVYVLPCIAGHVGADTAGVVLSEGPYLRPEVSLVVDVGTNAEIVLGNRERLLACSSPTGPAFEGGQISSGQRAAPGAIERVRIDPVTLEPRYKVIGSDLWSDEPGFDKAVVRTGVTGICGSGIIETIAEMLLAGLITPDGVVDGAMAARSPRVEEDGRTFKYLIREGEPRIAITQNDVRAIQLGKAALYAGVRLLMDRYGITAVDRITLAGAFGSHIDVKHAMILGLVPDCELDKVGSAGNAAGTGARIALLNASARTEIEDVVRRIEKVETAIEPSFQAHFVGAMAIPHKSDPFPHLEAALGVTFKRGGSGEGEGGGGRERRRRRG